MACSRPGSSQEANPFANAVQPIPAVLACRLAHSCPFSHTLIGYGKYDPIFTNAGPNSSSQT